METYPDEWERFLADPYAHRAPRAESYHDLSGEYYSGRFFYQSAEHGQSGSSHASLSLNESRMTS